MVYTTYSWWFGGWFIIVLPAIWNILNIGRDSRCRSFSHAARNPVQLAGANLWAPLKVSRMYRLWQTLAHKYILYVCTNVYIHTHTYKQKDIHNIYSIYICTSVGILCISICMLAVDILYKNGQMVKPKYIYRRDSKRNHWTPTVMGQRTHNPFDSTVQSAPSVGLSQNENYHHQPTKWNM